MKLLLCCVKWLIFQSIIEIKRRTIRTTILTPIDRKKFNKITKRLPGSFYGRTNFGTGNFGTNFEKFH